LPNQFLYLVSSRADEYGCSFKQMQKLRSAEIKLIGAFFLVAGLLGFFTFGVRIFPLDNIFLSILNLFPTVLFGFTFYSGYLLLLKENEKGLEIARAVSALQIIHFNIAGLEYAFITGAYLFFGFKNANIGFDFGLLTSFTVSLYDEAQATVFQINILALGVFLYLSRTIKRIEDDREIEEELGRSKSNSPQPRA
jgi:hypothetical protein